MFHPVGSQPPSVYWRRRLVFVASVIVLIVLIALTIKVLTSSDGGASNAAGPGGSTSATSRTSSPPPTTRASSSRTNSAATTSGSTSASGKGSGTGSGKGSGSTSATAGSSSAPMPKPCASGSLKLATATDKSSYTLASQPTLSLLVTNAGKAACVLDIGDKQIVMRVYNGESRVWGSHDCKIDRTPNTRTLNAGATVRLNITWTEYASTPNQCQNRQHVGAGTYTLYASLSGKEGTASQFTITP